MFRNKIPTTLLLSLVFPIASALYVISPPSLAGFRLSAPIFGRFFGPQRDYERNGTAVYFTGDCCETIPVNFTSRVLVYTAANNGVCTFRKKYLNMCASGAIASIESTTFPVAGQVYALHDGDWGRSTRHKSMPWLQTHDSDFAPIMTLLTAHSGPIVELAITVDENTWATMFASWPFILVVRAFVPCLLFATGLYGVAVLPRVYRERSAIQPTKLLVISIETVCVMLSGLFLAVEGMYATSTMPYPSIWFFGTAFFGWSMFTTACVAVFYASLNKATSSFMLVRNSLSTHRNILLLAFVLCVGMDLVIGCMFATYQSATFVLGVGAIMFSIGNFCAAVFFIYEKWNFQRRLMGDKKRWSAPDAMTQLSQHMGRWLVLSSVCLLSFSFTTPLLAFPFAWSLYGNATFIPLMFTIRCGTAYTQIRALAWTPPSSTPGGNQKKKHVTRWAGDRECGPDDDDDDDDGANANKSAGRGGASESNVTSVPSSNHTTLSSWMKLSIPRANGEGGGPKSHLTPTESSSAFAKWAD